MRYANPGAAEAKVRFEDSYQNFIGGDLVAPIKGRYSKSIAGERPAVLSGCALRSPRISSSPWMPRMPPRRLGAAPRLPSVRYY